MVAINCGSENFEIEDGVRRDACTFKAVMSKFKVENVISYPGRGIST